MVSATSPKRVQGLVWEGSGGAEQARVLVSVRGPEWDEEPVPEEVWDVRKGQVRAGVSVARLEVPVSVQEQDEVVKVPALVLERVPVSARDAKPSEQG